MKNILIIILTVFLFVTCVVSCNPNQQHENSTDERIPWQTVTEYEYHGHSYIKFGDGYQGGVVHNPDCKCFKNNN